jgi:hypothetical protein
VKESHQAGKLDTSGTAKAVISCFKKLGVSFDDQVGIKAIHASLKHNLFLYLHENTEFHASFAWFSCKS